MRALRRLGRATIWAPGAIPAHERKYATPLKRFLFPSFDIVMVVAALRAMDVGAPSLDSLFPTPVLVTLYTCWAIFGAVCFIGASFPALWKVEIGGKVALFIILFIYLIALRGAAIGDEGARDVVSAFVIAAMLIPPLRLWILGIEERDRKES